MDLQQALKLTYLNDHEASKEIKGYGYRLDKTLLTPDNRAYHNKADDKLLLSYRGTQNFDDI
jgi:hypothetical protein